MGYHTSRLVAFLMTVFNARLSDFIEETLNGMKVKIRFLRVNERHHTVAIGAVAVSHGGLSLRIIPTPKPVGPDGQPWTAQSYQQEMARLSA